MTDLFDPAWARAQDDADPLRAFRDQFHLPLHEGAPQAYFCGNSLGLQPKGAAPWSRKCSTSGPATRSKATSSNRPPWMPYHALVRDALADVVGAQPSEVVAMNSLTANLHLMLVSFYRPTPERPAILMEAGAFPLRPACARIAGAFPRLRSGDRPDRSRARTKRTARFRWPRSNARSPNMDRAWPRSCGRACSTAPGRRST
jgi:kynureninase